MPAFRVWHHYWIRQRQLQYNQKMKRSSAVNFFACLCLLLLTGRAYGQNTATLSKTVLQNDSLFWEAYNACDIATMEIFFTEDVEFYHDRSGLTTSKKKFFESIRAGLCGNPDRHLRREALRETIMVFPLDNFGAIMSGEHVFYVREKGKEERLDGLAKFTHVWRFKDNEWKMHRILSYDHLPAK
jgi:hypothetical protein